MIFFKKIFLIDAHLFYEKIQTQKKHPEYSDKIKRAIVDFNSKRIKLRKKIKLHLLVSHIKLLVYARESNQQ